MIIYYLFIYLERLLAAENPLSRKMALPHQLFADAPSRPGMGRPAPPPSIPMQSYALPAQYAPQHFVAAAQPPPMQISMTQQPVIAPPPGYQTQMGLLQSSMPPPLPPPPPQQHMLPPPGAMPQDMGMMGIPPAPPPGMQYGAREYGEKLSVFLLIYSFLAGMKPPPLMSL